MDHYKLPVYNTARELVVQLTKSTQKVPRDIRMGFFHDMQLKGMAIMKNIAFANYRKEARAEYLQPALSELEDIQISARILLDLGFIHAKGFAAIIRKEAETYTQLEAWRNSTLKQ